MIAKNIIEDEESAVVIMTDGEKGWKTFDGGFAITGDWILNKNFAVHKAIIYKRDRLTNRHEVYTGTPFEIYPSKLAKRFVIRLADVNHVGTTENDWCEFTESKKGAINPVKYINRNFSKNADLSLLNLS